MKKKKSIQIKEIHYAYDNSSTMDVDRIKELLAEAFFEYYQKNKKDNFELKQGK